MTIKAACDKYWVQVGKLHTNAGTTYKSLGWLVEKLGPSRLLTKINDAVVADLVVMRRSEFKPSNRKSGPKVQKLVGPATVNRTMTEVLRKVMNRARKVWKAPVADVDWSQHKLEEPKERIREATHDEEAGVMDQLERGYDDAVAFAFASGCRRMEIIGLIWNRIDFGNRCFTVIGKGRKGQPTSRVIPMTEALYQLLWSQRGYHAEYVFTYEAARTSKRKGYERVRGVRYKTTDAGLRTAMRRAVSGAGVTNLRFHDTRHTMATRTLRNSNIKVVQNMLGHERITTTEKYAHAMVEDVRAAMEAASPTRSPTEYLGASHRALPVIRKSA